MPESTFPQYDLFLAGTDTSTAFIEWTLLYMAKEENKDKQDRAYNEIKEVIGDRFPRASDKVGDEKQLPIQSNKLLNSQGE